MVAGSVFMEAGDRIRTGDPQLGKLMLYQLSYARDTAKSIQGRAAPQGYPALNPIHYGESSTPVGVGFTGVLILPSRSCNQ